MRAFVPGACVCVCVCVCVCLCVCLRVRWCRGALRKISLCWCCVSVWECGISAAEASTSPSPPFGKRRGPSQEPVGCAGLVYKNYVAKSGGVRVAGSKALDPTPLQCRGFPGVGTCHTLFPCSQKPCLVVCCCPFSLCLYAGTAPKSLCGLILSSMPHGRLL